MVLNFCMPDTTEHSWKNWQFPTKHSKYYEIRNRFAWSKIGIYTLRESNDRVTTHFSVVISHKVNSLEYWRGAPLSGIYQSWLWCHKNYRVDLETILTHTIQLKMTRTRKQGKKRINQVTGSITRLQCRYLLARVSKPNYDEQENGFVLANKIMRYHECECTTHTHTHTKLINAFNV